MADFVFACNPCRDTRSCGQNMNLAEELENISTSSINWKKTVRDGLDLDYAIVIPEAVSNLLLKTFDKLEYYQGDLAKVKVFGKWHKIPRQQIAYGSPGMIYRFSGVTLPAKIWDNEIETLKNFVCRMTGIDYNFVLINRYKDGKDHIGEHRDGEAELDKTAPIVSISLGASRDFLLKHRDVRKSGSEKKNIPVVKLELKHGSILLMNPPTNEIWYHSVPPRKNIHGVRINLTFRKILQQQK